MVVNLPLRVYIVIVTAIGLWGLGMALKECWDERWTEKYRSEPTEDSTLDALREESYARNDVEAFVATVVDSTTPTFTWHRVVLLVAVISTLVTGVWLVIYLLVTEVPLWG